MSEEKKDLTPTGDNPSQSAQPEGTGENSSSPSGASASNEDTAKAELESLQTKYSESSKEAKRLKSLVDENEESMQEKSDYIESLEKAIDEKDEEKEEKKEEDVVEKPKVEPKSPETKPELPPYLTKEGQRKAMQELLSKDKKETAEAEELYENAMKEFPRLKDKTFANLVSQRMKIDKVGVKDACKKVSEDLTSLGSEEKEEEPFVEGGVGKSTAKETQTEGDKIRTSLTRDISATNLPGMA